MSAGVNKQRQPGCAGGYSCPVGKFEPLTVGSSPLSSQSAHRPSTSGTQRNTAPSGDASHIPAWTVVATILMLSIVAGVSEEAGFRGAMQVPLERAYGPTAAIAITSVVFTLVHLSHGKAILPFLPFYFVVAVIYGLLAYLTGSILPAIILHAAGDAVTFGLQYVAVRIGAPPIAKAGSISPLFVAMTLLLAALAFAICRLLARETHAVAAAA